MPASPASVFRIASISKPIAATAVLQLVERGLVSLDDPIQRFAPWFPRKPQGEIRIRHLLTHTSGIRHYRGNEMNSRDTYPSVERAAAIFKDDPLLFAPGDQYAYSTYGYNLLAAVVESASGRSFDDYLRTNVFAPAGMSSTFLERPQEVIPGRAHQYVRGAVPGIVAARALRRLEREMGRRRHDLQHARSRPLAHVRRYGPDPEMGAVGGVATLLDLRLGVSLIPKDAREIADLFGCIVQRASLVARLLASREHSNVFASRGDFLLSGVDLKFCEFDFGDIDAVRPPHRNHATCQKTCSS